MEYLEKLCSYEHTDLKKCNYKTILAAEKYFSGTELDEVYIEYYENQFKKMYPKMPEKLARAISYYWRETGEEGRIYEDDVTRPCPLLYESPQIYKGMVMYYTRVLYDVFSEKVIITDVTGQKELDVPINILILNLEEKNKAYFEDLIFFSLDEGGNLK